ncbi:hypothetical protein HPB50_000418 [Hyalomma asiaticum]|uniref:Uncharacterized protein n=1 Tax=Hyalomma asiaticum TaxID=266040 RepID=A0ACB7RLI2_HYAAI|nr:hypothetical protein HPB50_000418 [Hyalomma asiaticum]
MFHVRTRGFLGSVSQWVSSKNEALEQERSSEAILSRAVAMAEKREYPSRRKSTAGLESSALHSERASSKTKLKPQHLVGAEHSPMLRQLPSLVDQYSGSTVREGSDAQTPSSGYVEARFVPALEDFAATSPDAPPKPQPIASPHMPHAVLPAQQHVPTLPDETPPPSDTAKHGKGKDSKHKSSRRRCSSAGKHSYDTRSSTSSASQRVPSEKDRDHSVPARQGSPEPHTCHDVEEQPTASSGQATASKRRKSLKPKKDKATRREEKEVSPRSVSVISDHTVNDGRYERQTEDHANALATKGDGADNESRTPQKPVECSSASLPGIPTEQQTPGRVSQQATESAAPIQTQVSAVLPKGNAARADDVTVPGSAKDNARTGNADQQSNVIEHVSRPTVDPKITTTSVLCIDLFVICVAAASMTLIFVSYSDNTEEVACVAPRCLAVRGELYGLLNASADPCVNFYDHVCGHWNDRESGGSFRGDNVKAAQVKLQEAITSSRHENYETEGASVLSQVYMACERYMATETTLTEVLQAADTLLSLSTLRQADSNAQVAGFLMRTSIETGLQSVVMMMIIRDSAEEPLYVAPTSSLTKRFVRNEEAKDTTASDNDSWRFLLQLLEAFPDVKNVTSVAQLLYWLDADLGMALDLPHKSVLERAPLDVAFEQLVDGVSVAQWMKAANMFLPAWRALGRRGTVLIRSAKIVKKAFDVLFSKGVKTAALYVSAYVASYVATMERDKHRVRSGETTVAWSCLDRASECLT